MGSGLIFPHPTGRLMAGDAGIRRIGVIDAPVPQGRRHFDPEVRRSPGREKPCPDDPSARTGIRHRCARRASEGVRENPREGTRQNDPVPSVQGVLSASSAAENRL
jgi:hypothetical protein